MNIGSGTYWLSPARGKIARVQHHAALPWRQIGSFMHALRQQDGIGARALEITILTAARTGEVIGARWPEIEMSARLWTAPGERMKAGREHRVPLSEAAMNVLAELAKLRTAEDGFVFLGARRAKPLSNMTMAAVLERMGRNDLTVHGFRSAFDWCAESTNYPREVAEAALANMLADKTEAAYRRGDLFEKRRRLMEDWAGFCAQPNRAGEVVMLRRGAH
ncbi:MAG: site-specific integrase [Acetobacteraceae bacterium]|nr:site-specific integrase [Acetobacteraceae bacterium]